MKWSKFVISLVIPFIAGGLGSIFTFDSIPTWYAALNKPFFNPPNWVFGPAWTILYAFQGIALYLFWNSKKKASKSQGFKFFLIQVVLNALWSIIFFGLKIPIFAIVEIIFLWIFIFLTIKEFKKFDKTATYLLYPYLAWVTFASLLNLFIVFLN